MKFTVVTPSWNQGAYLAETLHSVITAADRAPEVEVEHWVIDAGSTDQTLEILRNQKFACWVSEPDQGQTDALNKGFSRASGEIVSWLCSDDLLEPDAIAKVAESFRTEPRPDVVYGDYYFLEGQTGWKRRKQARPFSVDTLRRHNFLGQPSVFFRKELLDRFGPLDTTLRFCMDHEFWLRIAGQTTWFYVPEPLASMRLHADAKTSAQLAPAWWEAARMTRRYGLQRPYIRRALWMQFFGQFAYRFRRRVYRMIGRMRSIRRDSED